MKLQLKPGNTFPIIGILIFLSLGIYSLNFPYFWDTIQQVSKEGHWFYLNNFKYFLLPNANSNAVIVGTGYHPPLMGILTALMWKIFGYHLVVSHLFILAWSLLLVINLHKLILHFLDEKIAGWVLLIIILEPTVLTQFIIASPDFILITSFIMCLRFIIEKKPFLLGLAFFFLCGINMRGLFAGIIVFGASQYYHYSLSDKENRVRLFFQKSVPFAFTFSLLIIYYIFYFMHQGWFFSHQEPTGHYALPNNANRIIKHILEFGLRCVENGRFIIWIFTAILLIKLIRKKIRLNQNEKFLFINFIGIFCLYFIFIFISQMPFSARYFMPFFIIQTILCFSLVIQKSIKKKLVYFTIFLTLLLELTGNFWIYPNKIAKPWDCTLAHIPYYTLREECFDYIEHQNIKYKDVSGGFCLYGNRKYIELLETDKVVESKENNRYFIYSNISNLEDEFAYKLENPKDWVKIKSFKKGFVELILYKNLRLENQ